MITDVGEFAVACIIYCQRMDASETSGYRTAKRNTEVGGIPTSSHRLGLARDVEYDRGLPNIEVAKTVARKLGLFVYRAPNYEKHDHLRPLREGE